MNPLFQSRYVGLLMGVTLAASPLAQAQTPSATKTTDDQQSAYRSSIAQETARKQAEKIKAEILQLATELKLNGLSSSDLALLSKASNNLDALSQEDMQKVINALQSASASKGGDERQKALVNAFQGQKDIALKLKSLAVDLASQESQREIPSKLQILIARQSANIRQTSALPTGAMSQLTPQQASKHDVVISEQTSIAGEIDLLFKALAAAPAPATPPAPGTPDITKTVLDAMNASTLKDASQQAVQITTTGPFPDAVTKQTSVRDYLTSILRTSVSSMDAVSRLSEVKAQLGQLIGDEKDLASVAQESKIDGSILAERQSKLNDFASVTQALLKPINSAASDQVSTAQQGMTDTSAALAKAKTTTEASPKLESVITSLVNASDLLDKQIAAAQAQQNANPADKLAALQQLKAAVDQAQANPQTSAADLQKLQQQALAPAPQAASKIADAADQLQPPKNDTAAADKLLADASAAIQQQEDALKQAAQDYQALAQANQQLQQAQQLSQAADQNLQNKTNPTETARDLAQAQAAVTQASQTTPPDVQQALQQAANALQQATTQAVQAQTQQAQAQNQQAQAAMQQAQKGLAQAMAQVQQQSQGQGQGQGQPQQPGQQQQSQSSSQAMAEDAPEQSSSLMGGMGSAGGPGQVVGGLKPKDRDAIAQFQAEKSPPEYAPAVQQYFKNLADSSDSR